MAEDVIYDHIYATLDEDIKALEPTLSANIIANGGLDVYEEIFELYDFDYELTDIEVLDANSENATVRMTYTTIKISGPEFANNTIVSDNYLVFEDGMYKIDDTEIVDISYLDDEE